MSQKPIFARLKESVGPQGNQSALFRWFLLNHDKFAKVRAMGTRPGWPTIAAELTAEGLSTNDGGPITADYARQAWWRAQKAHKAKAGTVPARKSRSKQSLAKSAEPQAIIPPQSKPEPSPAMQTPSQLPPGVRPVEDIPSTRNQFSFAKPKDWTKTNKGDE